VEAALTRARHRVPLVRHCGAAALASVLGFFGKHVSLDEVRTILGSGRDGSGAAALLRCARSFGLRGRGVRVEVEDLDYLPAGSVLFWEFRHFVVFESATRKEVRVVDPAGGRRRVPMDKFRRAFTGVALVFEPSETFEPAPPRPKRIAGLFKQVLEHRDLLWRIVLTSILVQMLAAALPLLTGVLIDRVVPRRDHSLLLVLALGYAVFQMMNAVAGFVRSHLFLHLRTQLESKFTLRFMDHLVDLPYSYFQQHTSGDLMVRLGSNSSVREILTSTLLSTVMDGTMASIYLVLLLLASPELTAIVVVLALARVALLAYMRIKQRQFLAESLENQARSQTSQVEMLSGMETLKAMGLEHRAADDWASVFVDGLNVSIRRGRLNAAFGVLLTGLETMNALVFMFYGTYLVLQGTLSLGTMMAFSALAAAFLGPLNNLVSSALQLQMLEVYVERLNDVMETPPEQSPGAVVAGPLAGAVALENVSFRYALQSPMVLDDVSLRIEPGSRVALVGRTGSGKSTLARLLAGLYEPASGRVLFDGRDLKGLDRRSVRSQLGIVTQETQLFGGSIRRNIALCDPQTVLENVIEAAKVAGVHDDIVAMPMGYETLLTDRGLSLSGGQRQRLAIARAVASRPKILVLDEATSHLDALTEQRVNESLSALRCTRIVIAHRLSTIRDADLIVVVEAGKIVEQGRHEELLDRGGRYAELLGTQKDHGSVARHA
jgi:ATP-binding cassette subfamily B protein